MLTVAEKSEKLTNAEYKLMKIFWSLSEPITTNDIMEHLPEGNDWKITTVLTLISKLVQKEFVGAKKSGRAYSYSVLVDEESYKKKATKSFLEQIHGNSLKSFFAALYDSDSVTKQELEEIEEWLINLRSTSSVR